MQHCDRSAVPIDVLWVKHAVTDDVDLACLWIDAAEETTAITFMAGRTTNLIDADEQRVGVAIVIDRS